MENEIDRIDVTSLTNLFDPLLGLTNISSTPNTQITTEMIQNCILEGYFVSLKHTIEIKWTSVEHAARIAYLVVNKTYEPIDLDFGVPSIGNTCYPLLDGHHRFAAAIHRGDEWITAKCAGEVSEIEKYSWSPNPTLT